MMLCSSHFESGTLGGDDDMRVAAATAALAEAQASGVGIEAARATLTEAWEAHDRINDGRYEGGP